MVTRESIKMEIDILPDEVLEKISDYILFQKFQLDILDDTDYLNSVPGFVDRILNADNNEWFDESVVKW